MDWMFVFIIVFLLFCFVTVIPTKKDKTEQKAEELPTEMNPATAKGEIVSFGSPLNNNKMKLFTVTIGNREIYVFFNNVAEKIEIGKKIFVKYWINEDRNVYLGVVVEPPKPEAK
ncbi:MAG: hypothetical protein V1928_05570 [Parcubacteria group bacterium]